MVKTYFKTALRNILKNRGYSFLNIIGLAIGIASASLIFLWVEDELNFDGIFENRQNIYLILENQSYEGEWRTFGSTPGPLAPALEKEVSGVEYTARTIEANLVFTSGEKAISESGLYADPAIFDIFQIEFLQGKKEDVLKEPNSVVISEKIAAQFFGVNENIIGKTIRLENKTDYKIMGVIPDFPDNVSLKYDWVLSYPHFSKDQVHLNEWDNNTIDTYVSLFPDADVNAVDSALRNMIEEKTGEGGTEAFLFAMPDWRLRGNFVDGKQSGGDIVYVRLFSIIAWVILIIACINFMNLTTAKSQERANEVGVRKVLGAGKGGLFSQFIIESLSITGIAVFISLVFIAILLPQFNMIVGKNLIMNLSEPLHLGYLLSIFLFCGLLSGSYPAIHLALLKPIASLKGKSTNKKHVEIVRKSLVVLQFTISVALIVGTLVVYQQIQHVQGRQLGYDTQNLIQMEVKGNMVEDFNSIKNELIETGVVENAALNSFDFLSIGNNTSSVSWKGKDPDSEILISHRFISPEFLSTANMQIIEGRDFEVGSPSNISKVIITESLSKMMGTTSAVGKTMSFLGENVEVQGVIRDYLYGDMYGESDPVIFFNYPKEASYLFIRINQNISISNALANIQQVMESNNPGVPFDFQFVDENYQDKFKSEQLVNRLSLIFAALAIFISCLGLFGLAAYTAEQRKKEIGVRKVLGASVKGLASLLSKDFLKLVTISCIIAFPIAWYVMDNWLQDFAYRIEISWWVFILAGLSALFIALITVSFQAVKAAIANPIKNLKTE